ncbi:cytochrome P450 [Tricladium varicosporioides]|nr:cytochrome P450 [Hymenoscyphus varicosporioides]
MEYAVTSNQALAALCFLAILILGRWYTAKGNNSSDWVSQYPIVGAGGQYFSVALATLRSFSESQRWAFKGYAKYSKANVPFIIPCLDRGNVVMIPPKQLKKVYNLPESILDVYWTQNDTIQTRYTIGDQDIIKNGFQMSVIRNQITRNLAHLTPVIATELKEGFNRYWGDTSEWKELRIWDSCLKLIAGAANGAFCGTPLCRDVQFLDSLRDHAMTMFVGALAVNGTPKLLRPVSGAIVSLLCAFRFNKTLRLCLPFIKERLENTAKAMADPTFSWTPPKDGLQWIIEESYATNDPQQLDPTRVTHRLLYVNDISLHSTSFTVQNVILDIYNAEDSLNLIEALREECSAILREAGGSWTREAVQKLKLVDATIRESMRLTPFASVGLPRTVVDPHGISLEGPNGKLHIPQGTVVAMPMDPIHHDEDFYPDAAKFNPYRFMQPGAVQSILEKFDPENQGRGAASNKGEKEKRSTVTLDDALLGFGFGKHACAGRFFALNEMKMFVAHMVLNYDVKCLDRRPALTNVVWLKIPFNDGKVRVRKRPSMT